MPFRHLLLALFAAAILSACGGGDEPVQSGSLSRSLASVSTGVHTFSGVRANYAITQSGDGYVVEDRVSAAKVTVPRNARLRFADGSLALDTEGVAGQVYRLYQAAFARTPDAAGVGFWIASMESGTSLDAIASGFVRSEEYRTVYGENPSNQQIVERYYQNVLGRPGEASGINFWKGVLDRGAATAASVLKGFSESTENQAMVAAAISAGIPYIEQGVAYAPVANPGRTRTATAGTVVTLDGSLSTVSSGRNISYAWTLTSRPSGSNAVLVQSTSVRPAFFADRAGNYEVSLTVSDGSTTSTAVKATIIALWKPDESKLPATGNFVYLQSDVGDYIGAGQERLYTSTDTLFSVNASGARMNLNLTGDDNWHGEFVGMNTLTRLERGYYGDLTRAPFSNPTKGGLEWSGEGRGCNTLTGWFVVDSVTYEGTTLTAIDLRFEQHCEGGVPALRGRVRWSASETSTAPGPVTPPVGLWQPAVATPATGNYVHLESSGGDYIGAGRSYTYTSANSILAVSESGAKVNVRVDGDEGWWGDFAAMQGLSRLEKGYYGGLQRYPFHNPVKGGLSWSGEGRGCNTLAGWFVVDHVAYEGNQMVALDLRFEQRCEGGTSALRGKIHWTANDTTAIPGPVRPPPAGLWQPAASSLPASGNYVYLQSMQGDYIGGGQNRTFTDSNSVLSVTSTGALLKVNINGNSWWNGDFAGMNTLSQLEPGYYGDLQRYPFHNPVKGGLDWGGDGRGCNTLTGWFVIDKITYVQGSLTEVDMRFEQHCEGGSPALRGRIRWNAADVTKPSGPIT
jgi:hypothetical protein